MKNTNDKITNNLNQICKSEIKQINTKLEKKLTLKEFDYILANEFNMSSHSIEAIRANKYNPRFEDMLKICKYFKIGIYDLMNIDDDLKINL